jgi:hypothetical protein
MAAPRRATAAASDKDLQDLWRTSEDEWRGDAAIVVDALLQKSRLKPGLDRAAAIDIVWILTSSDIFWRLVRTRRWSHPQFESWLGDTLDEQLLPQPNASPNLDVQADSPIDDDPARSAPEAFTKPHLHTRLGSVQRLTVPDRAAIQRVAELESFLTPST